MSRYILAIDQGTTGSTVLVLNESLEVLGRHTEEFLRSIRSRAGWHDLNAILTSVQNVQQAPSRRRASIRIRSRVLALPISGRPRCLGPSQRTDL